MTFRIDIIPLVLGMMINMGLGALWYSDLLFAKPWMREAGISAEEVNASDQNMGKIYGLTAFAALVTSWAIGFIVNNLMIDTVFEILILANVIWLGFDFPKIIKNWGFENRSIKLGMINHMYDYVVYVLVIGLYVLI